MSDVNTIRTTFVVSGSPDRIEPAFEETPTAYRTAEEAGEAIKEDRHGEYGTLYVLSVAFSAVAEYHRPWTLVRKDPETEENGHA